MREAFASQNVQALIEIAEKMDEEVFQHHLNRCIQSGLWVPNAKEQEEQEAAAAAKKGGPAAKES